MRTLPTFSPRTRFLSTRAMATAASLALLTACGTPNEAADKKEEAEPNPDPSGFTDFSGVVVVSLMAEGFGEGGQVLSITLSVYDPDEDTQLTQLTAGEVGTFSPDLVEDTLKFSPDFSHLAYIEEETSESAILVYQLEGQEGEAELVRRIEPPDDDIAGERSHKDLGFQPDGQRLWYSIGDDDDDTDDEVRSVGLADEEEPQDEGAVEFSNWAPDADGRLVEVGYKSKETEVGDGTAEVVFREGDQGIEPRRIEFTAAEATFGPQVDYRAVRPLGEDGEFLAGGKLTKRSREGDGHEWGPLMRVTVNESGEVDSHEVVISETEKSGVEGVQIAPDNESAVLALGDRGKRNSSADSMDFYQVDLTDPAEPRQLEAVIPGPESENNRSPTISLVGWLE